jgi:hypothetical protein
LRVNLYLYHCSYLYFLMFRHLLWMLLLFLLFLLLGIQYSTKIR